MPRHQGGPWDTTCSSLTGAGVRPSWPSTVTRASRGPTGRPWTDLVEPDHRVLRRPPRLSARVAGMRSPMSANAEILAEPARSREGPPPPRWWATATAAGVAVLLAAAIRRWWRDWFSSDRSAGPTAVNLVDRILALPWPAGPWLRRSGRLRAGSAPPAQPGRSRARPRLARLEASMPRTTTSARSASAGAPGGVS